MGTAGAGTTHSLLDWTREKAPRSSPWEWVPVRAALWTVVQHSWKVLLCLFSSPDPWQPGGRKESYPPTGCTCFLLQPRLQLVRCSNRTVSKTSSTSDLVLEVHLIFPLELLLQPTLLTLCLVYLPFPSFIKTEKELVAALYFQLNSYCSTWQFLYILYIFVYIYIAIHISTSLGICIYLILMVGEQTCKSYYWPHWLNWINR